MIQPQMRQQLKALLIKHEGLRDRLYKDTKGNWTIGIGRNLSDRNLLPSEIDLMFNNDVDYFYSKLNQKFPWFSKLNDARKIALVDLCFAGFSTFCTFKKMIAAFEKFDFNKAADEIIDSLYAKQVGDRELDLAKIIRTGEMI